MFTFTIHFQEVNGPNGSTKIQCNLIQTAIALFEQEYPTAIILHVNTSLNRPY
ncbi:hypothetical protein [Fibrella aestuarina]|uniref:hypothetical protein n=1 Tax=Fibrella aestuarina TaxID=651143 RepID=UPI0002E65259|nr:hypothetical protein [Fibrella aestuarina]